MRETRRARLLDRIEERKGLQPEKVFVDLMQFPNVKSKPLTTWEEFAAAMGLPPDHPVVNG